jgi:AcrR family transcriptional regulator
MSNQKSAKPAAPVTRRALAKRTSSASTAAPAPGLRERKKQQTRLAISRVATDLFIARGFENVTIAEVAQAADVSINTVFNYFATKEELFFDRGADVVDEPSRAVRERRVGESAAAALRRHFRQLIRGASVGQRLRPFLAAIEASPALKARARLLIEETEERLCATLIEETAAAADDPTARSVAALMVGVQAMLIKVLRQGVLANTPDERLRAQLSRLGERGFELLLVAAGDYCVRRA